jgi:hypothetical protein
VKVRVRRRVLLLVLLVMAALPASAFAFIPPNDTQAQAILLSSAYATPTMSQVSETFVPFAGPAPFGGWSEATPSLTGVEESTLPYPSCLGFAPYQSMWYKVDVDEASVLTITLSSNDVDRYQPVVAVTDHAGAEVACGLGGSDRQTDPTASASSFVLPDTYWIRIGSVSRISGDPNEGPRLRLTEVLQDVTPPAIAVSVSGQGRIVGPGKNYKFSALKSQDDGSGLDLDSAKWYFPEDGQPAVDPIENVSNPLVIQHSWATAGVHQVVLKLADKSGNVNSYAFSVLVHNFVPPKVSLRVFVPSPGDRQVRVVLTHNVPIAVHLVFMQNGRVLRILPSRVVKGSKRTTLKVALRKKVGKVGFVAVSGAASDLGPSPNTVPLLTCSVDPVNGGGVCG